MANPIDITITKDALKELDNAISKVTALDTKIKAVADSFITSSQRMSSALNGIQPNDVLAAVAANAQLTAQMQSQSAALAALQTQYNNLAQTRSRSNNQTAAEAVNQRLLNRNARESATITSSLAGAYGRLNAEHQRASRNLQDLIVRGREATQTQREYNRELSNARGDFQRLDQRVRSADAAVGRFNRTVGNYPMQAAKGIKELIQAFGITGGIAGVAMLAKNLFDTTKELMSLDGAMKLVTKTSENFANQQVFLQRISEAYGVEISALQKQFTQFYVSASDKLSSTAIQNIFESVAKSSAKMGLSLESQDRAFLALNQMMSKGTVTAEELRGQLGEALPGAFGIMARSMGVTEQQLGKMMKDGKVIASEVLPLFAKELEKTYSVENVKRVDNLSAAQTRFSNAWKNFVRSLDSDGNKLSKFFSSITNVAADLIKGVELIFQSSETKNLNSLKKLRDKGYSETLEYYKKNQDATEKDIRLHRQYNIQKIDEFNKEKKQIVERSKLFSQKFGERSFSKSIGGEDQQARAKAEYDLRKDMERLKAINGLSQKYAGEVSAINQLLQKKPTPAKPLFSDDDGKKQNTRAERAKKEAIELKSVADTISQINQQLEQLTVTAITGNESERADANKSIADLIELKKQLNALPTASTTILQPVKKEDVDNLKKLSEGMKEYLSNFTSDFISQSGFTNTFKILNKEIDGFGENASVTFNAIAESAQEMFNFISNASQANFDAEYSRLESQKDISLKFAGDSTSAKKRIEEDYEKKKKEIANRETKAKQKQAIFNIAIDTAQAIVATLARTPPPAGIPLAVAMGLLGAAQIAVVASQKIPQYFDGGVHGGGLAMINDAGGSNYVETVVTPDGKVQQYKGRDVVTDLPKGTEIFTPEQWQQKQLEYLLNSRGVMLNNQVNNGMTANEMDVILSKHFSKIQTNHTSFDRKGIMQWSEAQGSKTVRNANRASSIGFKV
jgi:tape measure domain-containing protein